MSSFEAKQPWSQREHDILVSLIPVYGRNFKAYETMLPGRRYNQIKSYYHNNKLGFSVVLSQPVAKTFEHRESKSFSSSLSSIKEEVFPKIAKVEVTKTDEFEVTNDYFDILGCYE